MKITNNNDKQDNRNNKGPHIPTPPDFDSTSENGNSAPNPGGQGPQKPWYKRVWVWVVGLGVVVIGFMMFGGHGNQKQVDTTTKKASSQSVSSSSSSSSASSESYKIPAFKQKKKNSIDMKPVIEKFFSAYEIHDSDTSFEYENRAKEMSKYASKDAVSTLIPDTMIYQEKHDKKPYVTQTKLRKPIQVLAVDSTDTGTYMVNVSYQNYKKGSNFTHDQTDKYAVNTDHNKIVSVQLLKSKLDN